MFTLEKIAALHFYPFLEYEDQIKCLNSDLLFKKVFQTKRGEETLRKRDSFLKWSDEKSNQIVTIFDANYPPLLKEIDNPPLLLTVVGQSLTLQNSLTVVGTTTPSLKSLKASTNFGKECSEAKIVVLSDFLKGIGSNVQLSTLKAGGTSWAVLGCGLKFITKLHRKTVLSFLMQGGSFITTFHPDNEPNKINFYLSKRILSGIGKLTLLFEAELNCPAMNVANFTLDQGKDVFIHSSSIDSIGSQTLIEQGAETISTLSQLL